MRTISKISLLFVLTLFYSCGTTSKITALKPEPDDASPLVYENTPSFISIPIDIKLKDIERRYSRCFSNFFERFKDEAFFWLVVDNSGREFQPICWGGNYSNSKTAYYSDELNLNKLIKKLDDMSIDPKWGINIDSTIDTFSPFVFSRIQEFIKKEIKNRPKENYISISENGDVKFIPNN